MQEWSSPYNSFNSMKALMWREWFEEFAKEYGGNFYPPVVSDIDLSIHCNYRCPHCNAKEIIDNKMDDLPLSHWLKVSDFLSSWGVKASCVAGGGEPMMHPGFSEFLLRQKKNSVENGIITNGSLMTDESIKVMAETCRYVGISVDACSNKTYMKLKGITNKSLFNKVLHNIEKLAKEVKNKNTLCDVSYKYIITPDNAYEIYEAAKIAKDIGVRDFHARPVGFDNVKDTHRTNKDFEKVVNIINEQTEKARELEDGFFRFFGIRHKFKPNFERKINFLKCRAIPLITTFGADGRVHLCFDMRGRDDLVLCNHYPNPSEILEVWSSKFHKDMMYTIDVTTCPRCTFGPYNEMVEQVFIQDGMCKNFP